MHQQDLDLTSRDQKIGCFHRAGAGQWLSRPRREERTVSVGFRVAAAGRLPCASTTPRINIEKRRIEGLFRRYSWAMAEAQDKERKLYQWASNSSGLLTALGR